MLAETHFKVFIWFFITPLYCVIIPTIPNAKLGVHYFLDSFPNATLHSCADMCVYVTDCMSVSFGRKNKYCMMYNTSPKMVSTDQVVQSKNTKTYVLLDIDSWPQIQKTQIGLPNADMKNNTVEIHKSRTGFCWNKPCGERQMCVPNGDSYRCHAGLPDVGCPPYNISKHGVILGANSRSKDVYHVGSYIQMGCEYPYVTTHGDPDNVWSIHCTDRKNWPPSKRCVSVAELCKHKILENQLFPSRVHIATTSSIPGWKDSEVLLESGKGWIASQNNEYQYIQITLDNAYWIGGLTTKGGFYIGGTEARWVTVYNVAYSKDCSNYAFVMDADNNTPQVFQANSDATSSVMNHFERQKLIKCLRVHPQGFRTGITMRLELLACKKI